MIPIFPSLFPLSRFLGLERRAHAEERRERYPYPYTPPPAPPQRMPWEPPSRETFDDVLREEPPIRGTL